ncbi:MAG: hypothetical protein ACLRMZ_03345 [Blautia marasmi]
MCNWEQAWLAYEPIENQRNRKFLSLSIQTKTESWSKALCMK